MKHSIRTGLSCLIVTLALLGCASEPGLDRRGPAMVKGRIAAQGQFPANINFRAFPVPCGGVAVSKRSILTAAHCVYAQDEIKPFLATGAMIQFRFGDLPAPGPGQAPFQVAKQVVKQVTVHPSFVQEVAKTGDRARASQNEGAFDLAVIETAEDLPAALTGNLPKASSLAQISGRNVIQTGAGCTSPEGQPFSKLHFSVKRVSEQAQSVTFTSNLDVETNETTSACEGDSGSPVFLSGNPSQPELIGIMRYTGAAGPDGVSDFDGFTRLDTKWLVGILK